MGLGLLLGLRLLFVRVSLGVDIVARVVRLRNLGVRALRDLALVCKEVFLDLLDVLNHIALATAGLELLEHPI